MVIIFKFPVGAPIDVVKNEHPDSEYVDKVHGQVIESLEKLFDQYKDKYLENSKSATLVVH